MEINYLRGAHIANCSWARLNTYFLIQRLALHFLEIPILTKFVLTSSCKSLGSKIILQIIAKN